jgi:uncharacterized membrane protein
MLYKGWIPSVSGFLSVTAFGDGDFPTRPKRHGFNDRFIVEQKRDLLDTLIPLATDDVLGRTARELLSGWVLGISGRFTLFLFAEHDEASDEFLGIISLFSNWDDKESIRKLRKSTSKIKDLDLVSATDWYELRSIALAEGRRLGHVRISRSGECSIKTQTDTIDPKERSRDHLIADQMYFFIKDIAHRHQHHHPEHDALTRLSLAASEDDKQWVFDTQQTLYRQIIRFKRYRTKVSLYQASGILAYTRAFERSFDDVSGLKKYYTDELEKSLEVARSELESESAVRIGFQTSFLTILFGILGLFVSAGFISRPSRTSVEEINPIVVQMGNLIASSPLGILSLATILSLGWQLFTYRINPVKIGPVKFVAQSFRGLRMRYQVLANIVLTAIFATISAWLLNLLL